MCAECIEQTELARAVEQGLMLVLAVDFDQCRRQRLQLGQRGRTAIDPRTRGSLRANHPPQLAQVAVVEILGLEPCARGGCRGERERCRKFRALAAVADDCGIGALAGQQQQGIHEQGLARTGLAGDGSHPGGEADFGFADDGKILDGESLKHGGNATMQHCFTPRSKTPVHAFR